jgi:hypothetical protein
MRTKLFCSARTVMPYLWGFAAASAPDYAIDVRTLFLPVLAGVTVIAAVFVVFTE